mmetsp:Transcript_38136/g.89408  ORF Transcript_38136/g.89408 Transcript_38136/m.89408 type:complete len:792 (-) Transcript_38136:83-2458(-)
MHRTLESCFSFAVASTGGVDRRAGDCDSMACSALRQLGITAPPMSKSTATRFAEEQVAVFSRRGSFSSRGLPTPSMSPAEFGSEAPVVVVDSGELPTFDDRGRMSRQSSPDAPEEGTPSTQDTLTQRVSMTRAHSAPPVLLQAQEELHSLSHSQLHGHVPEADHRARGVARSSPLQQRLVVTNPGFPAAAMPATDTSSSSALPTSVTASSWGKWLPNSPLKDQGRSASQNPGSASPRSRGRSGGRARSPSIGFMSQQYCWRRTERKVEAAFNLATDGACYLRYPELGPFLAHMGCISPTAAQDNGLSCRDGETARLCASMWRHLDPEDDGTVDLLTLVVFFHMLLGTTTSDGEATGRGSCKRRKASRDRCLHSLEQADISMQPQGHSLMELAKQEVEASCDMSDKDASSRLFILLKRFDSKSLRVEFKDFYRHKLYHEKIGGTRNGRSSRTPEPQVCTFVPCRYTVHGAGAQECRRNFKQSKLGCNQLIKSTGRSRNLRVEDQLLSWANEVEAKQAEMREHARRREDKQCPFRPQVLPSAGRTASDIHQHLYDKAVAQRQKMSECQDCAEKHRTDAELAGCTFQPDVQSSQCSMRWCMESTSQYPLGYEAATVRMQRGWLQRDGMRRIEESRTAVPRPIRPEGLTLKTTRPSIRPLMLPQHCADSNSRGPLPAASGASGFSTPSTPRSRFSQLGEEFNRQSSPYSDDWHGVAAGEEADLNNGVSDELLFNLQVRVHPDRPPLLLEVRRGDKPAELAAVFAARHALAPHRAQRVHDLLKEQMKHFSVNGSSS